MIQAVKKLQNTSRIYAPLFVSEAPQDQALYSWYASLVPGGRPGKQFIMYMHEGTRTVVLCPGKTIQTTFPTFRLRLENLLRRWSFPLEFIEKEMLLMSSYTVGKTDSRSMLGVINNYKELMPRYLEDVTHLAFEDLPLCNWEDYLIERPYWVAGGRKKLTVPLNIGRNFLGNNSFAC